MPALSGAVLAVVASALLLRPTGTEIGFDGRAEGDPEAVTVVHSADFIEMRGATSTERGALRGGLVAVRSRPVPDPGDDGEYVDPLADNPVSPLGVVVSNVGDFEDPDNGVPTPPPYGGISDVGDHIAPEEAP